MKLRTGCLVAIAAPVAVIALVVLAWFALQPWPISDPVRLKAVRAEALSLMATYSPKPSRSYASLPKRQWPATIASLRPQIVLVDEQGVEILIKPFFDGGWGYQVTRDPRSLPMPRQCYSEVSPGVFWHDPC